MKNIILLFVALTLPGTAMAKGLKCQIKTYAVNISSGALQEFKNVFYVSPVDAENASDEKPAGVSYDKLHLAGQALQRYIDSGQCDSKWQSKNFCGLEYTNRHKNGAGYMVYFVQEGRRVYTRQFFSDKTEAEGQILHKDAFCMYDIPARRPAPPTTAGFR